MSMMSKNNDEPNNGQNNEQNNEQEESNNELELYDDSEFEELQELPKEQAYQILEARIFTSLEIIADNIKKCADDFYEVHKNYTEFLPRIRITISPELERSLLAIAKEQMIPEFLFEDNYEIKTLKNCNIDDQRKYYIDHEKVKVYDGNDSHTLLSTAQMSQDQFEMVFDKKIGHKRSMEEQMIWLKTKNTSVNIKVKKSIRVEIRNGIKGATMNGQFFSHEQITDTLTQILKL